jgi:hypothetical protein
MPSGNSLTLPTPANVSPLRIIEDASKSPTNSNNLRSAKKPIAAALNVLIQNTTSICNIRFRYLSEPAAPATSFGENGVKIAAYVGAISTESNKVPKNCTKPLCLVENEFGKVWQLQENQATNDWRASYLNELGKIGNGVNASIVCFQEFAFPYTATKNLSAEAKDFRKKVRDQLQHSDRFIMLGSHHYQDDSAASHSLCNNGVVHTGTKHDVTSTEQHIQNQLSKTLGNPGKIAELEDVEANVELLKSNDNRQLSLKKKLGDHVLEAGSYSDFLKKRLQTKFKNQEQELKAFRPIVQDVFQYFDSFELDETELQVEIQKNTPALKLKEGIFKLGMHNVDVFATKHGVIAVLICHDVFDPSLLLRAAKVNLDSLQSGRNLVHPKIDLFLVPSFNSSSKFLDACAALSFLAESTVLYTNSYQKTDETKSALFINGTSVEDWHTEYKKNSGEDGATKEVIGNFEQYNLDASFLKFTGLMSGRVGDFRISPIELPNFTEPSPDKSAS